MKNFDNIFKDKLVITIQEIENNSAVEIIAAVKSKSDNYSDIPVWAASIALIISYTVMMFIHIEINVYLMYFASIFIFAGTYLLFGISDKIKRLATPKKRMNKITDIYSRAIFQKAGTAYTLKHTGILFFISLFEKKIIIIPDKGVKTAVPDEDWISINQAFQKIFTKKNIAEAFLQELSSLKNTLTKYIPPVENDINELPDFIEIDF